uniref:Uncharacterized protein n=1 Tax=Arundo donax TaxID=35708 RepID=A0A0A8Z558_ARUDO
MQFCQGSSYVIWGRPELRQMIFFVLLWMWWKVRNKANVGE